MCVRRGVEVLGIVLYTDGLQAPTHDWFAYETHPTRAMSLCESQRLTATHLGTEENRGSNGVAHV